MTTIQGPTTPVTLTATAFSSSDSSPARGALEQASLLQPPENQLLFTGDLSEMIAALGVMAGKAEKKAIHADRLTAAKTQEAAEASKLSHMKDAAEARLQAGVWSGAGQAAAGVVEGVGAGCTNTSGSEIAKAQNQRVQGFSSLGADGLKGGTTIVSAFDKHDGDMADIGAAADDMKITQAKRAYDEATDGCKEAYKVVTDAIVFYREYSSTKAQTEQAAIHKA